jgi:uncharacterized protein YecE (DUF72 family)
MTKPVRIRVGIGGWTYEPWRTTFYPADVPKSRELEYASRQLSAIEINGTFYRLQKPAVYAKWHDATPDDFVFSVKAPRYITQKRVLADTGDGIDNFIASGLTRLGTKLGPILWQLAPTKQFDAEDLDGFLSRIPHEADGIALRHALEVRHESFMNAEYLALARQHRVATVFTDSEKYPSFCDVTGDFVYARLMRSVASRTTGYTKQQLDTWASQARTLCMGRVPEDLPRLQEHTDPKPRNVYVFMINGAKERAPAAATYLLAALTRNVVSFGSTQVNTDNVVTA